MDNGTLSHSLSFISKAVAWEFVDKRFWYRTNTFSYFLLSHNDFVAILDLPEGEHQYKFFVDGQWVHDPSEVQ